MMDPTTLVTFLFNAPPGVRMVELLGSWDNFSQPYTMNHDPRRGPDFYTGCFKFDKIIYDGDSPYWSKPRKGGLKQGGTYWFYYRLDMDAEAYDDKQAHTNNCPLLPGQTLNVMEVPKEILPKSKRRRSMDVVGTLMDMMSSKQTMDPNDKYLPIYPPPASKVHGRCFSDIALGGRLEGFKKKGSVSSSTKKLRSRNKRPCTAERNVLTMKSEPFPTTSVLVAKNDENVTNPARNISVSTQASTSTSIFSTDPFSNFNFDFRPQSRAGKESLDLMQVDPLSFPVEPVQSHQSRPCSSSYSEPSQSGMYSLSNSDIENQVGSDNANNKTMSNDVTAEILNSMWSPTFSIDTVESNGLNTPSFQSAGTSRHQSPAIGSLSDEASIHDVSKRLEQLSATTGTRRRSPPRARPPPPPAHLVHPAFRRANKSSTSFTGYSLPQTDTISKHSFTQGLPVVMETGAGTLEKNASPSAGDLMNELRYLASCIA